MLDPILLMSGEKKTGIRIKNFRNNLDMINHGTPENNFHKKVSIDYPDYSSLDSSKITIQN